MRLLISVGLGLTLGACQAAPDQAEDRDVNGGAVVSAPADSPGHVRLYAVDRYERVRQLDPGTLEVIDSIETGPRPHGIVASPDGRTLYITVESSNEVIEVDVATHTVGRRARVGEVPNEPALSADGRTLFVPLRAGGGTDVVDTESMQQVAHLPTGAGGHNAYLAPDGFVYSTSMGDNQIAVIDPRAREIVRIVPVPGVPRPVAFTDDGGLAYVALSGLIGFVTLDLETDQVVDRVQYPIPQDVEVPPLDTYTHGLLLTEDQRELWVAAYGTDVLYGFLMPEAEELAAIPLPRGPHWLTLHPSGEPLYVSLERSGEVAAVHRGLREVIRQEPVGRGPTRVLAFRTPVPP